MCKDQESIQSSTTPDPGYQWVSDKHTEDTTNESQEVSPFPAGDHKAHINRLLKPDFSDPFEKIIKRYKGVGYSMDIKRQSACLVVNQIRVDSYGFFLNLHDVGSGLRLNDCPDVKC